jgi:hypothetical protein
MSQSPLYTSISTVRSLWQEYSIYHDRVELKTHLGTLVVPFQEIEKVEVRESDVEGLLHGELQLKGFRPALKLDWANFVEHVVIDKKEGRIKRILFTPDDPSAFKDALEEAMVK